MSLSYTLQVPRTGLALWTGRNPLWTLLLAMDTWLGRRQGWQDLNALDDHLLNDIGIVRQDRSQGGRTVFRRADEPAGFAEFDRRKPDEVELVQFGLTPPFVGRGLGKWFLEWTIDCAWSYAPRRFWLHTCSLDHRAALPNYLKRGFVKYKEEQIRREP